MLPALRLPAVKARCSSGIDEYRKITAENENRERKRPSGVSWYDCGECSSVCRRRGFIDKRDSDVEEKTEEDHNP
jgi:epoxyqueuosine reductase QueG